MIRIKYDHVGRRGTSSGSNFAADMHAELGQPPVLASAVLTGKLQATPMALHVYRKTSPCNTADKPDCLTHSRTHDHTLGMQRNTVCVCQGHSDEEAAV
jgi:hypothetical protein